MLGWGFAADEYLHLDLADLVLTQIGLGYDRRPTVKDREPADGMAFTLLIRTSKADPKDVEL